MCTAYHTKDAPSLCLRVWYYTVKSLNNLLPSETGIQCAHSPATLITGCRPVDYNTVMSLKFEYYVQAHETRYVTNNQTRSTVAATAM